MSNFALPLELVLRLMLGLVFLVSAAAKWRDLAAFVHGVLDYAVLPPALGRIYGRLLPLVELSTALLLLGGFLLPVAAGLAVFMLTSFAIAVAIVSVQRRELGCHCFGQTSTGRVGWYTLVRDLLLLAPAAWLLASASGIGGSGVAWAAGGLGLNVAAFALAVLLGLAYLLVVETVEALVSLAHPHGGMV